MKNSHNKQEENWSAFMQKIVNILHLTDDEIENLKKQYTKDGFTKTVDDILRQNNDDKKLIIFLLEYYKKDIFSSIDIKLRSDKEIALLGVRKKSNNFFILNETLKSDKDIGFELMKSFVREGKNFTEIEAFLEKHFLKDGVGEKLFAFYMKYLKKVQGFYFDDLLKGILLIKKENKELYNLLLELHIIEWKGGKIVLTEAFKKQFFEEVISDEEFQNLSPEEQEEYIKKYLSKLLGKSLKFLGESFLFMIKTLLKLSHVSLNIFQTATSKLNKGTDEEDDDKKVERTMKQEVNKPVSTKEKVDFSLNDYEYTRSSSGIYTIHNSGTNTIKLSEKEVERFTMVGLKNFIKFYNLLCGIGLNFLWDKYKNDFVTILNNQIGFNYPDREGVSESRSLKVLNFIGKTVGLIGDKKHTQYKKPFENIDGARKAFSDVKSTGNIGKNNYISMGMSDDVPVEKALKAMGYIDKGVLNIGRFYSSK